MPLKLLRGNDEERLRNNREIYENIIAIYIRIIIYNISRL